MSDINPPRDLIVHLVSDLHLDLATGKCDFKRFPKPGEADVHLFLGDLANNRQLAAKWLTDFLEYDKHTLIILVLGNHDYYGSTIKATEAWWRSHELVKSGRLRLLANDSILFRGVQFAGCTYWTDMGPATPLQVEGDVKGEGKIEMTSSSSLSSSSSSSTNIETRRSRGPCESVMANAKDCMTDYRMIKREIIKQRGTDTVERWVNLKPLDTVFEHVKSIAMLRSIVQQRELNHMQSQDTWIPKTALGLSNYQFGVATNTATTDTPLAILMHHLPTYQSVDITYRNQKDDLLNPCFASNTDDVIRELAPDELYHGHTHRSRNFMHDGRSDGLGTRIIANPCGYGDENPLFDPCLLVRIPMHRRQQQR